MGEVYLITIKKYENIKAFKEEVLPFLENDLCENNLLLGILYNFPDDQEPIFYAGIYKEMKLSGVFLQTIERQIILSKTINLDREDVSELAENLYKTYGNIPGLVGEYKVVTVLSECLANLQQSTCTIKMKQGVYKLEKIICESTENLVVRTAVEEDFSFVKKCLLDFSVETGVLMDESEAEVTARRFIHKEQLHFLLVEGDIVSMCIWSRPVKTNINISFVYTLKEFRKKGYGKDITLYVTKKMLAKGYKTATLYTDLENPTSNKIYKEIGYQMIMQSGMIYLD